jgi:hypothetical protein
MYIYCAAFGTRHLRHASRLPVRAVSREWTQVIDEELVRPASLGQRNASSRGAISRAVPIFWHVTVRCESRLREKHSQLHFVLEFRVLLRSNEGTR